MPKIKEPVKESFLTVGRPVVFNVVHDLLKYLNIRDDVKIFFPDAIDEDAQIGSRNGVDENLGKFSGTNKLIVNVTESYNQDLINTFPVLQAEAEFIFKDEALGIYIKPVYKYTDVNISFTYRATDKTEVERWRDHLIANISMMQDVMSHAVSYYYNVPNSIFVILKQLHTLRENVEPYGQTFEQYLAQYFTPRATETTNLNGEVIVFGITETQDEVIGHFEIEGIPDVASKDGEQTTFSITVPYKFTYTKVIECLMKYPNIVHNQVLSTDYWTIDDSVDITKKLNHFSFSSHALFQFRQKKLFPQPNTSSGVSIPNWDEFITPYLSVPSIRVFMSLVTRTLDDKKTLLGLSDLGDFSLDDGVIAFMRTYHDKLGIPRANPFIISVYKNLKMLDPSEFTVDSNLIISLNTEASLRDTFRVRLGIVTDLLRLVEDGINDLRKNPDIFNNIINTLKPGIGNVIPILDQYIPKKDYNDKASEIINELNSKQSHAMVSVMNLIIKSHGVQ